VLAGRYRVHGHLGKGGMGEVYRAFDLILNQTVALKFLTKHRVDESTLARFRNEVRLARQVSHPNVCRVYDIGLVEGHHFISMEYLDGEDLASLLRRIGRLPPDKATEFARKICAGLSAAHERGVLHRDLKPANIMIDGRGNVRIADFGLASLADEIAPGDVRSGTPAYMSPEQKAGREVTVRSDIYSLGLVLYEMFTGKRRVESQSSASELIKELDPAVDEVIRRCLEEDPKLRPLSALNVAVALPGGDPIAAALAAGETPSPEMVAASGEKEGFSARAAALCFAGVVVAVTAAAFFGRDASVVSRSRLDLPPEALAYRAQEMLKRLGYGESPARTAYGFAAWDPDYLNILGRRGRVAQDSILQVGRPAVIGFWYRQHRSEFWVDSFFPAPQIGNDAVTYELPPNIETGMIRAFLDTKGRLLQLEVRPGPGETSTAGSAEPRAFDERQLFAEAELDAGQFKPVRAIGVPPVAADAQMAWTGAFTEDPGNAVTVEAGWLRGKPVFFDIRGAWKREAPPYPASPVLPGTPPLYPAIVAFTFLAVLGGAALAARHNLLLGRGDRQGAAQMAGLTFFCGMDYWACSASHVASFWELHLLVKALSTTVAASVLVWALYLGIEPAVRRNWPDSLISWTRLQRHRMGDPLVASHVLAGTLVISVFIALRFARLHLSPVTMPLGFAFTSLNSSTAFAGNLVGSVSSGLTIGMAFLLIVVIVRLRIRPIWIADLVASAILAFGSMGPGNTRSGLLIAAAGVMGIGLNISLLWVLRRFGLLPVLLAWVLWQTCVATPISLSAWYAGRSLIALAIPAAIAAWSLWVIVTAQRRPIAHAAG
jgi:serine/threonine-protein kinase